MQKAYITASSLGAIALATMFCSGAALAQTETASAQAEAPQADNSSLGDIIVTAQRRTETLQNAGIAIDAVAGESSHQAGRYPGRCA